jgi:branched-chain amino acid transport system ATP-binding protein
LLKAIAGVIALKSGTVTVEGRDATGLPSEKLVRRGIAYVPQVANVFPQLTVQENLEMGGYSRRHGIRERIDELYQLFPDLKLAHSRHAETLSGGQRTMLAMARGLMVDPAVLLLDEPSAGLSPAASAELFALVKRLHGEGMTVVMVEQNALEALKIADRAYLLVDGRNAREGRASALAADATVRRAFLGG